MHLDRRQGDGLERVEDRDRGVAVGGGVDHDGGRSLARSWIHSTSSPSRWVWRNSTVSRAGRPAPWIAPRRRRASRGRRSRLARPEQVEIRSVEDIDRQSHIDGRPPRDHLPQTLESRGGYRPAARPLKARTGPCSSHINGEPKAFDGRHTVASLLGALASTRPRSRSSAISRSCRNPPTDRRRSRMGTGSRSCASSEAGTRATRTVAGREFRSRLIFGTGKYKSYEENARALEASGAEIVTVAVRRVNLTNPDEPLLVDFIDPKRFTYLPNTAGCYTGEEAVRTLRLAARGRRMEPREARGAGRSQDALSRHDRDPAGDRAPDEGGFEVMVLLHDDPLMCRRCEEAGAVAIMPLGAPIGSGLGIQNPVNIRLIKEGAKVPVLVDAGVGTASDAAIAMELGWTSRAHEHRHRRGEGPRPHGRGHEARGHRGRQAYLAGGCRRSSTPIRRARGGVI